MAWLVNFLRYIPGIAFIALYYWTGKEEVVWLFGATFAIIHAKGDEIKEDIATALGVNRHRIHAMLKKETK